MENIGQMRKRHEREVESLQENCPHTKLSKWVDEYWAIAHGTGFQIKVCTACGEVVRKQTACRICEKVTEEYKDGLGTHSRPYGSHYCSDCVERSKEEIKKDEEDQTIVDNHIAKWKKGKNE